ncbi:kinase-like protein [Suillus weaverae]|nr:kinase-like protein [Suillus weaverae]
MMIYEFDASTLETVGVPFQGHTNIITDLALSFDCALLASASADNTIKLWAFESRQLLSSFNVLSTARHIIFSPDSRQLVFTTLRNNNIYLCNTTLTSIQPVPQVRTNIAPRNLPPADVLIPFFCSFTPLMAFLHSNATALPATVHLNPIWHGLRHQRNLPAGQYGQPREVVDGLKPHSLAYILPTCNRITEIWLPQHHRPGLKPLQLPEVPLHSHRGPVPDLSGTTTPPARSFPPPLRIPSSTISRLFQLPPKLLPSSSHVDTVLPVRNDEPHNLLPETMLQDLSKYITKDGKYPVARGGFGEIWKCTYHVDRRSIKVAVKALQVYASDQLGAAKTKKIKRIRRELRICANLKHANILPVYGYMYGFGPFIALVSPWAENGNLSDYLELEGAALTLVRRFRILRDIIAGLQYLHAHSIIHGDFTGSNVLIHGDGTACVADFGLSLMYSEVKTASQASWMSTLKGNMRWMAPELLVEREDGSQAQPSEQSDMYSFGGIMLLVLTNKVPYYHLSNDAAIILCIVKSQTPSRSRYPELPERYWQFIEQCWSTHPRDRPSTEGADSAIRNEFYSLSRSG